MPNRKIFKCGHFLICMVTKYDLFEVLYNKRHPLKPIELLKALNKDEREYDNIHRLLKELT